LNRFRRIEEEKKMNGEREESSKMLCQELLKKSELKKGKLCLIKQLRECVWIKPMRIIRENKRNKRPKQRFASSFFPPF
jgi:hypothetical protein